jgi:hypothetical protein
MSPGIYLSRLRITFVRDRSSIGIPVRSPLLHEIFMVDGRYGRPVQWPSACWGFWGLARTVEGEAVFMDRGRGDDCRHNRPFRAIRRIREADMNGFLPYRETTPGARVGGIRGWQADILRGES